MDVPLSFKKNGLPFFGIIFNLFLVFVVQKISVLFLILLILPNRIHNHKNQNNSYNA